MATDTSNGNGSQLLLVGDTGGITVINPSTPLKRLNYFDGKFLRAADFDVEQHYLRQLVALSNQGLGPGVVYGYDTTLGNGDSIHIGPGLAVDPSGTVLLLQASFSHSVTDLIEASKKVAAKAPDASGKTGPGVFSDCVQVAAPPPVAVVPVSDIYVIVICSAEALCGQQDVYGVLCQDACISSTDRPYRLDGIVVRVIPLQLVTPFPTSKTVAIDKDLYLRSKVAHSWFADEMRKHPSAISRDGLLSTTWCLGAGYDSSCCEVPLAVVARAGATTQFLDAWIVRRERIDAPAKRYWQWKMRMRPWDVFLAQVLQFQCQLAALLSGIVPPGSRAGDPCAEQYKALGEAALFVEQVRSGLASFRSVAAGATLSERPALLSMSLTQISDFQETLQKILKSAATPSQPTARILIHGGIIELSPAGYLPVVTGTSVSVNDQVRALLGEGVDLRFCITTADYVAHAVEEAQHMDRISLLEGLDDPKNKPHVDILVPDGKITSKTTTPASGLYAANLSFSTDKTGALVQRGTAREEALDSGGTALYTAMAGLSQLGVKKFQTLARSFADRPDTSALFPITGDLDTNPFVKEAAARVQLAPTAVAQPPNDGLWLKARAENEIKSIGAAGQTPVSLRIVYGAASTPPLAIELNFNGTLAISGVNSTAAALELTGTLSGLLSVGILEEVPIGPGPGQVEFLFTERFNWPVTLTYAGGDSNGSITLDLNLLQQPNTDPVLRLTKTSKLNASLITYELVEGSRSSPTKMSAFELNADGDVINPTNYYHQTAEVGLSIIQTALIVTEPDFQTAAEALLFPSLPPGTEEFTIQAIRDWVAFTKRREEQCAKEVEPIPTPLPRRYRVINLTVDNAEVAKRDADTFTKNLQNPEELKKAIQELLSREDQLKLVVTFAGGSATAQTNLIAAEADWKTFHPGSTIYFAAIGAVDEIDPALQISRVKTFESAISADSKEDPAVSKEITIVPYPSAAKPADADGIMLFITFTSEVMHVYGATQEQYNNFLPDPQNPNLTLLSSLTPLGAANYTVGASGELSVKDSDVKAKYQQVFPGFSVGRSLALSRQGDPDEVRKNRTAAATKIVKDLDAIARDPESLIYSGSWPAVQTPSILVVEALFIIV